MYIKFFLYICVTKQINRIMALKTTLNLRYEPTQFTNLAMATQWANGTEKESVVMLGCNGKFWVVCFADGNRLNKQGYQYAN